MDQIIGWMRCLDSLDGGVGVEVLNLLSLEMKMII